MAEVWKGEAHFEGGDVYPVAIKRVLPNIGDASFRALFEDEARLGMQLRHPNIVRVYDARDVGGTYIMVMELVEGDTLKGMMDRGKGRPLPLATSLYIGRELAKALAYAHEATDSKGNHLGVVHRDVSPHNLLLGQDGGIKLMDFGLADASVHETSKAEGMVGGKLAYLAPELIEQHPGDRRVDLFALGIVMWEMLAGRQLFQREDDTKTVQAVHACEVPPLPSINKRVPGAVDAIVRRLLDRDPDKRIAHGEQAAHYLDQLLRAVDERTGPKDVQLLVKMHLARKAKEKDPLPVEAFGVADLLAQELEAFANAAAGSSTDLGAMPLDPESFGFGSGVRTRP